VAFPFLVGGLALSTRGLSRALGTPSMVLGGRLSFALYLVHVPVFEVFWTLMGWYPRLAPGSTLAGLLTPHVLLLTVPLAYVLYRFVEEPARRRLRDLAGPRGRVSLPARHETADETLRALPAIGAPRRPRTPEVTPAPRPGRRDDAVGPVVPVGRTRPEVPSGTV
jgi:peptidoglycan/LPS O-acetylase OafA/YrhL